MPCILQSAYIVLLITGIIIKCTYTQAWFPSEYDLFYFFQLSYRLVCKSGQFYSGMRVGVAMQAGAWRTTRDWGGGGRHTIMTNFFNENDQLSVFA